MPVDVQRMRAGDARERKIFRRLFAVREMAVFLFAGRIRPDSQRVVIVMSAGSEPPYGGSRMGAKTDLRIGVKGEKMKQRIIFALIACAGLTGAAQAAVVIDFESDATGAKPNGWQSDDSALVSFTDSMGANLDVYDYGNQSHGQALAVNSDDPSYLIMDFAVPVGFLSFEFGNDDPGYSAPGDLAILTAFLDGGQVGQTSVVMNRDDIMNQSISISGLTFDRATFFYDVTGGSGLIEIVDNIQFEPGGVIPVPGALVLGSLGAGLVGWLRRRRTL